MVSNWREIKLDLILQVLINLRDILLSQFTFYGGGRVPFVWWWTWAAFDKIGKRFISNGIISYYSTTVADEIHLKTRNSRKKERKYITSINKIFKTDYHICARLVAAVTP